MKNTLNECPVPCLQHEGELQDFLDFYKKINAKKVLEIGTFYGGTMWFFLKNNPKLETFISIDMPIPPTDERFKELNDCKKLWENWFLEKDHLKVSFQEISGSSHDKNIINIAKTYNPDNDVDLLFIDGDHSYQGVKDDYYNYELLVRKDGYIVFHDITGIPEVAKFWNELKETIDPNNIVEIIQPEGWGFGIILKD